jgi:predicted RNA binding protein YcfA (HicA-like mRNA interferase family)
VTIAVPRHGGKDVNKFTVPGIIADAGLTVEEYNEL